MSATKANETRLWRIAKLGDICAKITDGTHHSPPNRRTGDFKYVTAKNIRPSGLDLSDISYVDAATHREIFSRCDVRKGDILYVKDGATTGRVALNTLDEEFSLLSSVGVLRPNHDYVLPKYLLYALQAPAVKDRILADVAGVAITRLTLKKLKVAEVPLAPLDRQGSIVAEIEKQFSRLDEAVANLKRVKANLKRYKAAVLKAAVEGRLVPREAEIAHREGRAYESAHELLQQVLSKQHRTWQGKHGDSSGADDPNTDGLPDGWCWCTIEQIAKVGTGATPSRSNANYWQDADVAWVSSAVVNEPYVDAASEFVTRKALSETNLTLYPPGTLLVAMYGEGKTRGKCTELRIPATTNQAIAALQVDSRVRSYLKLFLEHNYEELRKIASGGVQPNLNLGIIRTVSVPLPPLAEQRRIVVEADRCLSVVTEIEREVALGELRAGRLRQAVLSAAIGERL